MRRAGRTAALAVAMLVAAAATGCSFSWDSSGINDVLFGGRKVGSGGGTESSGNADAAAAATPGQEKKEEKKIEKLEEEADKGLRKIAVLPTAWSDGAGGGQPCDLCPASVQMKPTSATAARLVTGFTYEAIARHPRLLFPPPVVVEKTMAGVPGHGLKDTAAALAAAGKADAVVVSALVELRPRVGPDDGPEKPAGVALFMALVDAKTGAVKWSDTFDDDESGRGWFLHTYDRIAGDKPVRWSTAEGYSEHATDELVKDLIGELD